MIRRLAAAACCFAAAAFLMLLARDVWHWQRAIADADTRAASAPSRRRPGKPMRRSHTAWRGDCSDSNDDLEYRGTAHAAAELAAQRGRPEDVQGARGRSRPRCSGSRRTPRIPERASRRGRPARGPALHRPSVPRPGRERVRRRPERADDAADAGAEGARAVPARGPARPRRRQRSAEPRADVAAACAAGAQERSARRRRRPRGTKGVRCAGPRARLLTLAPDVPHARRGPARPRRRLPAGRAARRASARSPRTRCAATRAAAAPALRLDRDRLALVPVLLGLALAQPVLRSEEKQRVRSDAQIFYVFDISNSMRASRRPPQPDAPRTGAA